MQHNKVEKFHWMCLLTAFLGFLPEFSPLTKTITAEKVVCIEESSGK